ncbi:hypothetical protein K438DRAFT_1978093 [Mycena galopus ATCC 62051]|nr:hypothetical protein K438DRAFT_1978093 [Mycena galopus ATCC 62051]
MKQSVLLPYRVKLLLAEGHSCYCLRRTVERKRMSVRGFIVGQGEGEIAGLTDNVLPKSLGPKRATKIKRFFSLRKEDDVRTYVVREAVSKAAAVTSRRPSAETEYAEKKAKVAPIKARAAHHK